MKSGSFKKDKKNINEGFCIKGSEPCTVVLYREKRNLKSVWEVCYA